MEVPTDTTTHTLWPYIKNKNICVNINVINIEKNSKMLKFVVSDFRYYFCIVNIIISVYLIFTGLTQA